MSHLSYWRFVQIQLQPLDNFIEVPSIKTHYIFGYTWSVIPVRDFSISKSYFPTSHIMMHEVLLSHHLYLRDTHPSPKCTAFSTPTAAVLCQSKLCPI